MFVLQPVYIRYNTINCLSVALSNVLERFMNVQSWLMKQHECFVCSLWPLLWKYYEATHILQCYPAFFWPNLKNSLSSVLNQWVVFFCEDVIFCHVWMWMWMWCRVWSWFGSSISCVLESFKASEWNRKLLFWQLFCKQIIISSEWEHVIESGFCN